MAEELNSSQDVSTAVSSANGGQITVNQVKFVGVEYPGYIRDENHMLETLGGEDTVSRTYSNSARRLELSFRPEDPYAHAVCGDRYPTANLLLRVKRWKKKQREATSEPEEVKYEQEILGIVGNTFKFEVMADYQYLAPDMPDFLKQVTNADVLNQDVPYHLQPPVFSRFDRPSNYNYNPEPQSARGCKANQGDDLDEIRLAGTRTRNRRPAHAIAVNFITPEVPSVANPKAEEAANKLKDGLVEAIKKLFINRPVWSRAALQCHLTSASHERMKQLLAATAYYWLNGPWRTLWTRIGYDPRKDPSAKIYQMVDFRVGSRKIGKDLPIKAKRSSSTYILPNLVRKTGTPGVLVKEAVMVGSDNKQDDKQSQDQDLPYVFTPNKMPKQKQLFYQVCDLHDPEIQRIVSQNDGQEDECLERDGWFLPGTNDKLRAILCQRTTELAERLKQEQSGEGRDSPVSQLQLTGEEWGGHEGVQNYLQMLEQDDDIEAYDIFDDFTEGDD
ncbi:general transcription factor 3C polypeptide 5-like [Oculina patagonica]